MKSSRSATLTQRATWAGKQGGCGRRRSYTIVRRPSGAPRVISSGSGCCTPWAVSYATTDPREWPISTRVSGASSRSTWLMAGVRDPFGGEVAGHLCKVRDTKRPARAIPNGANQRTRARPAMMLRCTDAITARADGNRLIARLLTDLAVDSELTGAERAPSVADLAAKLREPYLQELHRAGADDAARWNSQLRPVLAVVAAAGVGPVLPLTLLCTASGRLGDPSRPARVRDVLVSLRGLVVRGAPGTPGERTGVFHTTFAEFLLDDPSLGIDPPQAHAALADAIEQLAPRRDHNPASPLNRYRRSRRSRAPMGGGPHRGGS